MNLSEKLFYWNLQKYQENTKWIIAKLFDKRE